MPQEAGYQPSKTRLEKTQAKYEKRVLSDFRYQMQTRIQEPVAFVDMEFMEMSGFWRDCIGGEKKMIRDGVFNEQTVKIEDQMIISGSTLEYVRYNWVVIESYFSFAMFMRLAEWHDQSKYPRMIARLPMEPAWSFRAED